MKTSELKDRALDWAVSHCREWSKPFPIMPLRVLPYSTVWAHGGPIIALEEIDMKGPSHHTDALWTAWCGSWSLDGPTPLIAAMRAYVASKLGDEVEIPNELL